VDYSKKLHEDHAKHCLSLANSMIQMNLAGKAGADLTPFEHEVGKIMAEYPNKPHSIVWSSLAVQAGLERLFELAYRFPSGDGAHMTLGALHRHYKEEGGVTQTVFHPDKSDLRSTLLAANASLVHLLGLAQEFMGLADYEAEGCATCCCNGLSAATSLAFISKHFYGLATCMCLRWHGPSCTRSTSQLRKLPALYPYVLRSRKEKRGAEPPS
jgi:hypothetical protein